MEEHLERIKRRMITYMKRFPPKNKRSATQFNLMYDDNDGQKTTLKSLENLIEIFESNYKTAKKEM